MSIDIKKIQNMLSNFNKKMTLIRSYFKDEVVNPMCTLFDYLNQINSRINDIKGKYGEEVDTTLESLNISEKLQIVENTLPEIREKMNCYESLMEEFDVLKRKIMDRNEDLQSSLNNFKQQLEELREYFDEELFAIIDDMWGDLGSDQETIESMMTGNTAKDRELKSLSFNYVVQLAQDNRCALTDNVDSLQKLINRLDRIKIVIFGEEDYSY